MAENHSTLLPLPRDTLRILEAKILLSLQQGFAGGGGGGAAKACIIGGVGPPTGTPPCPYSCYIEQPGPNFGFWLGDQVTGWSVVIAQGP